MASPQETADVVAETLIINVGGDSWDARQLTAFLIGLSERLRLLAEVTAEENGLPLRQMIAEERTLARLWGNSRNTN